MNQTNKPETKDVGRVASNAGLDMILFDDLEPNEKDPLFGWIHKITGKNYRLIDLEEGYLWGMWTERVKEIVQYDV